MGELKNCIIEAKLNPPMIKNNILERNELIEKVKLNEKSKLTMIIAPGGYGKTILTYQIVNSIGKPFMWYHLDETDNDPMVFFYYLFHGFSKHMNGFEKHASIILEGIKSGKDNAYGIAAFLIDEANKIQYDKFYIVFDDFHVINDKYIIDFLNIFLKYSSGKVNIIINSRKYSSLDISKLKEQNLVVEIEKNEIKFSFDEFLNMIDLKKQLKYDENILEDIYEKSEGWPLALNVFIKESEKKYNTFEEYIGFIKSGKPFFEYFIFQVYNNLPEDIKEFLLKISILDKITVDACNYITGNVDSQSILKYLVKNNVFINSISSVHDVYLCHQLFKKFLQEQLGMRSNEYYLKAGEYYFTQKNYDEAIEYFIKCKESRRALEVFKYAGIEAVRKGRLKTAERWIDFFENNEFTDNKWIALVKASMYLYKGMFNVAEEYINQVENLFYGELDNYGYYIVLVTKSRILLYRNSLSKCIEIANLVIQMNDKVEEFTLYEAFMQKAYGEILKGDFEESIVTLEFGIEILNRRGASRLALFIERYLTVPYFLKFEYHKAVSYYNLASSMSDDEINITECFSVDLYLARTYRDMGKLNEAKSIMENTIRKKQVLGYVEDIFAVYYQLATLYRDLGDYEIALKYANLSEKLFKAGGSTMEFAHLVKALKALIMSDMGNVKEAKEIVEEALLKLTSGQSKFMVEVAYYSAGIIFIKDNNIEKAKMYLESGYKMSWTTGLKSMISICGGILAGIYRKDDKIKGESYTEQSLTLAAGQDYIQVYLTNPEMDECIAMGFENDIEKEFITQIISRLDEKRVKHILRWLVLNSSVEKVDEFLRVFETRFVISKNVFSEIVTSFLTDENNIEELIVKLKPFIQEHNSSLPKLVVCCFGSFKAYSVLGDDIRVKWRTNKEKELLAYFIHNCEKEITTEKILADIWPDYNLVKARKLFYTNMALVRQVLNKCGLKDNLIKIQSGYIFNKEGIYCDEWAISKDIFNTNNLLKKGYLNDIYSDWVLEAKNQYEIF